LVLVENNKVFTNSLIISEGVGLDHRSVIRLIKKHSNTEILSGFEITKLSTKGRPIDVVHLSELQATFLITLMSNSEKVIDFKVRLTKAFFKQRSLLQQLLSNKQNAEWLEKRRQTKVMRRESTDVIQRFVEYAKQQGSKSAEKYYMNFSRMELTGLFLMEQKYPNARDVMSFRQLNLIEMADEAIAISLADSMDKELPYKECFQIAKEKISLLARIFPKSPLPVLLSNE
jgi:phage regulator Rha-like protein